MNKRPPQIEALDNQTLKLREWNEDFLVIVKDKDGNLCWRSSDKTWAMGAAVRYLAATKEQEAIDQRHCDLDREDE